MSADRGRAAVSKTSWFWCPKCAQRVITVEESLGYHIWCPAQTAPDAPRADPRQTGLFDKRQGRLSVKGGETMRKRSVPVTLAGKPR